MKIGELIKRYRDEHAMSMDSFAQKTGLSKSYVSMLERNKDPRGNEITPSIETIYKVSIGVNMPFDDVFKLLDQNQKVVLNSVVDDNLAQILKDFESVIDSTNKVHDGAPAKIVDYIKAQLPLLSRAIKAANISAPHLSDDEAELLSLYRDLSDARKNDLIKFATMFYNERG